MTDKPERQRTMQPQAFIRMFTQIQIFSYLSLFTKPSDLKGKMGKKYFTDKRFVIAMYGEVVFKIYYFNCIKGQGFPENLLSF